MTLRKPEHEHLAERLIELADKHRRDSKAQER